MIRNPFRMPLPLRVLLGVLVLLVYAVPSEAVLGTRRRTAVVVASATKSADAAKESAAVQQATAAQKTADQTAAAQSAAAASQASAASAAAASQAAAAAAASKAAAQPAAPQKTPQQQLQELKSLLDQKLISQSDYDAAKKKILDAMAK